MYYTIWGRLDVRYFLLINLVITCFSFWGCGRVSAVNDAGSGDADTDSDTDSDSDTDTNTDTDTDTDPICASIPNWTEHIVDDGALFWSAFSVCAADVDSDGDLDILGAAALSGNISWWESDCIP